MRSLTLLPLLLLSGPVAGQPTGPDPEVAPEAMLLVGDEVLTGVVAGAPGFDRLLLESGEAAVEVTLPRIGLPETARRWRRDAHRWLWETAYGERVTVRVESWGEEERHPIGRAYLGARDLRRELVAAGLAFHCPGSRVEDDLAVAQEGAREAKTGVWEELVEPGEIDETLRRACAEGA